MRPALLWFRVDLRLADNPALQSALAGDGPVIPVFIWAPDEEQDWPPGGASRWWLHQSLESLSAELKALGSRLILRSGPTGATLHRICSETGARSVICNRRYEPAILARDRIIKDSLESAGVELRSYNAALLHEPSTIQNKAGKPFRVFTPFWKHCLTRDDPPAPLPVPKRIQAPTAWPSTVPLGDLRLEPRIKGTTGMRAAWQPGTAGAAHQLRHFFKQAFTHYSDQRNRPDLAGTSRLSPHLHFGEISPRQIWHGLRNMAERDALPVQQWRNSQFLAEVGWREFSHHLLFHFPHTATEPLRPEFARFKWRQDPEGLEAWRQGRTGYPIVDAGMRELWTTGWMHNRVRMVVASFLVKDLLISWREGAAWFWSTLVDADLAQNTLGWQWTAGCGADAAPFFRVFNPTTQGEKFDPNGDYVRKWCPELARLPAKWIHRPHETPADILKEAGVRLGESYPEPIVSHGIARNVALEAYARLKK